MKATGGNWASGSPKLDYPGQDMQAISLEDDVFVLRRQLESLETKCDRLREKNTRLYRLLRDAYTAWITEANWGDGIAEEHAHIGTRVRAALAEGGPDD
jgi:hypothetical protein